MKTFLLNIPNSIQNWSNSLDAKTVLCSRSWLVFNDEGIKELYIFQKDGSLIASHNGKVTRATWQYLSVNGSLLIDNPDGTTFLLKPAYYDDKVLALQVDGTKNIALMIGENHAMELALESLESAQLYITNKAEYDNQQSKTKEDAEEKEKARVAAWEKFIEEKVEEKMNSPEMKEEFQKIKIRKKWLVRIAILVILIIFVLIGLLLSGSQFDGIELILCIVFTSSLPLLMILYFDGDEILFSIKQEIKKEYPLEKFEI